MKNYTLVLYKSDGCNTCRGCVMEQWGSDFSLDSDVEESDAIDRIAYAFTKESEGGSYTAYLIGMIDEKRDKYDHSCIADAEKVIYEFEEYTHTGWRQQAGGVVIRSSNHDAHYEEIELEGKRLNCLIRDRVTVLREDRRLRIEKEKVRKQEEEAKQKEIYERQQLAALQNKYAKE